MSACGDPHKWIDGTHAPVERLAADIRFKGGAQEADIALVDSSRRATAAAASVNASAAIRFGDRILSGIGVISWTGIYIIQPGTHRRDRHSAVMLAIAVDQNQSFDLRQRKEVPTDRHDFRIQFVVSRTRRRP